jgi:hypothetical protein
MNRTQTALMVLRVWTEPGSATPVRVDIRQAADLARGFRRTLTFTDIDLVVAAVREFLESSRRAQAEADTVDASTDR